MICNVTLIGTSLMIKKIDLLGFGSSLISLLNCLCKYYVHSYQIFYLYFKIFLKQLLSVIDLIFFFNLLFLSQFLMYAFL